MEQISHPLTPHFSAEISTTNTPALAMTFWYNGRYWANFTSGLKPMIISPLNPMLKHGVNPTFAIRAKKRLFLDICRLGTIDFTEVDFKNSL